MINRIKFDRFLFLRMYKTPPAKNKAPKIKGT